MEDGLPNFDLKFENYVDKNCGRFKIVSKDEKEKIMRKRKAPKTNESTKLWVSVFTDYLKEKRKPEIELLTNEQLADILGDYYTEVKKKNVHDGEEEDYKTSSLNTMRGALTRHFKETRGINIQTNELFIKSNEMFLGVTKMNKEKGLGVIDSKPPINETDLETIAEYFENNMRNSPTPGNLQEVVIFNIIYYLCRRGRENLRTMQLKTFAIATDPSNGQQYVYQKTDEADKNHSANDTHLANEGRMYENLGSLICPVSTFHMYLMKLNPKRNDLWQRPKKKFSFDDEVWFDDQVIGRDPLNDFMKNLSKKAKLTKIYTNHSIRATCITKLDNKGFEARHIQAVSGHKCEATIRCYSKKCPSPKKREMSEALALGTKKIKENTPTATVSKPPEPAPAIDFLDFVPIENNAGDFDLVKILDTLESEQKSENQNQAVALNTEKIAQIQSENASCPQNMIQNISSTQNMQPFVPKMMFSNSTVTINYNFNK